MQKHAETLQKLLGKPVTFIDDIYGEKAKHAIQTMKPGNVVFLDNVRKYPGETEKKKPAGTCSIRAGKKPCTPR